MLQSLLGTPEDNPGSWWHSHTMFQEGRGVTVLAGNQKNFLFNIWLIAEESLVVVAERIRRMFTLGHGSDLTYDPRRCFRRDEGWSFSATGQGLASGGGAVQLCTSFLKLLGQLGDWNSACCWFISNTYFCAALIWKLCRLLVAFQVAFSPLLAPKTEG